MQIKHYQDTRKQANIEPAEVPALLAAGTGVVWVDLLITNDDAMSFLKDTFALHPLLIEDLYHQDQRPKAEEFHDYLFVVLSPAGKVAEEGMFRELAVVVGKNYVITAHMTDEPTIAEAQQRLQPERTGLAISPTYILYVLFDTVLDDYVPVLQSIETQMEQIGTDTIANPDPAILNRIFSLQRIINQFWWVMWPQQDIISVLTNHDMVFIDQKSLYYLRDISDHLIRIMNSLQIDRDTVTNLIHIYMSAVSNRLNYAVGRLTLLTIGVGIFAVFSGFYGMNFTQTFPPFDVWWGVPAVLVMMLGTLLGAFGLLRWRKWI